MGTVEVTFAISEKNLERLDRMAAVFAGGDREAFLEGAILHAELRDIQNYGAARAAELGLLEHDDADTVARVHRVLAQRRPAECDPAVDKIVQQALADTATTG
jgi:hypothetical protein